MAFTYDKKYTPNASVQDAEKKKKQYEDGYRESDRVTGLYDAYQNAQSNKPEDWLGGKYGALVNATLDKIMNRQPFSYNLNGDMLYKQYKDQYINQGKLAMQDTVGQVSALTGGYGNSYAQTAGQSIYNQYMGRLNDKIPELYNLALQQYQAEGDALQNQYALARDAYSTEYGEYGDRLNEWNNERDRAYNVFANERANEQDQYNANRNYAADNYYNMYAQDYGRYGDDFDRALGVYRQNMSDAQNAESLKLQRDKFAFDKEQTGIENALARDKFEFDKGQAALNNALARDELELNRTKYDQSAEIDALRAQVAAYEDEQKKKITPTKTDNTDKFEASMLTKAEFQNNRDGSKKYGNYTQYLAANIIKALNSGSISDAEAEYLYEKYGLGGN